MSAYFTDYIWDIGWSPLVDAVTSWILLGGFIMTISILILSAGRRRVGGTLWRGLALLFCGLLLLGPSILVKKKQAKPDIAVVITDHTASQDIGNRSDQMAEALAALKTQIADWPDTELRISRLEESAAGGDSSSGSRLFAAIAEATADIPQNQLAGVIAISDGQIHDSPSLDPETKDVVSPLAAFGAPLHVLLTGDQDARDRRLVVEEQPRFGIVSRHAKARLRLEDHPDSGPATLTVKRNDETILETTIQPGESLPLDLPILQRGDVLFTMAVDVPTDDIAPENNQIFMSINGVRERLRVLLVSGQPYEGTRVWRDFLKSDPSVDLVHFTILRPPNSRDPTPQDELSLISFPVRELFETKLEEFDLVIFDRYWRRGMLSSNYLHNVADYVRNGGALLEIAGPYAATSLGLGRGLALRDILAAQTTGRVMVGAFRPELTELGNTHPVTRDLVAQFDALFNESNQQDSKQDWGSWFRHIEAELNQGTVLMRGLEDAPLLILRRVGEGRVAQLMSDHVWLWARGYEGGGPYGEFLRRLAHWLMKEPELEENALTARIQDDQMMIESRRLRPGDNKVTVTTPSGESQTITLSEKKPGLSQARMPVTEPGLYRLRDGTLETLVVAGMEQSVEFEDLRATAEKLQPAVQASGGGLFWLATDGVPALRRVDPGDQATTENWMGLLRNDAYQIEGTTRIPIPPVLPTALVLCALLAQAWRREST